MTSLVNIGLTEEQLIELWETFLMQFDADEDGEPFFKPPALAPAPLKPSNSQEESKQFPTSAISGEGETDQAAAAAATLEPEE
jgi:hypothetical protein